MGPGDAAPDGSELASLVSLRSLVNVDNSLAEVVFGGFGIVDTFDLQNRLVRALNVAIASESEELRAGPETDRGVAELAASRLLGDLFVGFRLSGFLAHSGFIKT